MLDNFLSRHSKRSRLLLALALVVQLVIMAGASGTASAEGFVESGFEQQWKITDEAVAKGQISRTYFWGPQAFAHTNEVYNESPNNGQRRVQYFDKARMELSKRPGQDPNLVTNGLLTVELVRGRLQVGDNKFLIRQPANNPVAGDPAKNDAAPTYASFNRGKLAFGVEGATPALDRTNLAVVEAVNKAGEVSLLAQAPATVRYGRYFSQTGHNLADVFDSFFQAAPLGESRWLSVMGYPTSEPFWAKDKVTLAGKPTDVLIQLFERRILTYTPTNPAGFQVEMGNIGQHYYSWRYNLDIRDEMPGNLQVVYPLGSDIWSVPVRRPLPSAVDAGRVKIATVPQQITNLWTLNQNRAAVATESNLYLIDLTRNRAVKPLELPAGFDQKLDVRQVVTSSNGRRIATIARKSSETKKIVQVYNMSAANADNLAVDNGFTAFEITGVEYEVDSLAFSADGRYLAFASNEWLKNPDYKRFYIVDLDTRTTTAVPETATKLDWIGQSNKFLLSLQHRSEQNQATGEFTNFAGAIWTGEATSSSLNLLITGDTVRSARISPDGNHFILNRGSEFVVRALANPTVDLTPTYSQVTSGRVSRPAQVTSWSSDGTCALIESGATLTAGAGLVDTTLLSIVTGKPLRQETLNYYYNSLISLKMGATFYLLIAKDFYNGPDRGVDNEIIVLNMDGSDNTFVYKASPKGGPDFKRFDIMMAQLVQVVPPAR